MAKKSGLGRGLTALFDENALNIEKNEEGSILTVRISDIEPDKTQPRKNFEPEALASLADSISTHGILQPIVVRRPESADVTESNDDTSDAVRSILKEKYKIVAGERRWRAAKMAGLSEVPVIVRNFTDKETAAIMLVENLQREDLNPVEMSKGLARLIDEFELTQEEAATAVGISRPALTNSLRLLSLPEKTLKHLEHGDISAGHARALITAGNADFINDLAETIISKQLSVRETEKLVKAQSNVLSDKSDEARAVSPESAYIEKLEANVSAKIGYKVKISKGKKGNGGTLEIRYKGNEELENLIRSICGDSVFED